MNKTFNLVLGLLTATLLASCGGGGGSAGSSPLTGADPNGSTDPTAARLTLLLNATSINNSGAATVTATATAATNSGQALSGIPITFSVDNGATFTQSAATTGTNGQSTAVVSIGANPSNRVITVRATSGSLSATAPFAVTGAALSGTAIPAIVVPGSTGNKVDFRLVNANGAAMVGQAISVSAGSLGTTTGTTGVNGDYSYTYTAPAAIGALDITATAGGVSNTQTVTVQSSGSSPPAAMGAIQSASVSANPSVVSTNTATTNNRTEVRALFVGLNNLPIRNVRVRFRAEDLVGNALPDGRFSTDDNLVYSDASGIATTAYIPGGRSSPTNGVIIRACYSAIDFATCTPTAPLSATTTITIAAEPLSVSIGSNNAIVTGPNDLTYIREFVVLVVDASGRAKGNVDIVPSVDLERYYKGQYVRGSNWFKGYVANAGPPPQLVAHPGVECFNEDINRNAVNEAGDDINRNNSLEPRKSDVAVSILGNGKTDDSGAATVRIEYPQNVASWLRVKILIAATGVSGTEGRATWTEVLPVPIDAISAAASPAFIFSPYGTAISNADVTYPDGTFAANVSPCQNPN
jgi:hypothetical protein